MWQVCTRLCCAPAGYSQELFDRLEATAKRTTEALERTQVGKAFYLAEFATYIEAVTKQPIPWSVIAELVNAAQPENWKDKQVDPSLLQKNFTNFTSRNEELYRETRAPWLNILPHAHCYLRKKGLRS